MQNVCIVFCILHFAFCISCSIPNLEPQSCIESRTAVREFYSFHFGNEMRNSPESLKLHERFLTPEFVRRLESESQGIDPFTTGTDELPKAFRVGECRDAGPDRSAFQVLLFWKDDYRSEQRTINVEMVKTDGKWLLDRVDR